MSSQSSFVAGFTFLCDLDGQFYYDAFKEVMLDTVDTCKQLLVIVEHDTLDSEFYSKLFSYFTLAVAVIVATYASFETGNYIPVVFTAFFALFGFTIGEFMDRDKKEHIRQQLLLHTATHTYKDESM